MTNNLPEITPFVGPKFDCCVMCLDISPDCQFIREAVFRRGYIETEPLLIVDPLTFPGEWHNLDDEA
jgi:hypothetical protein